MKHFDTEVTNLCKALNSIEGIRTLSSCCGHDEHPYKIWFEANNIDILNEVLWAGCCRWWDWQEWTITVSLEDPDRDSKCIRLLLESKETDLEKFHKESLKIEQGIKQYIKEWKQRK